MAKKKLKVAPKSLLQEMMDYMVARDKIRLLREANQPPPWTNDPVLQKYRFTNVHRFDDYTTGVFRSVYRSHYRDDSDLGLLVYNAAVARYFGTVEFYVGLGWQNSYDRRTLLRYAESRIANKQNVFTSAYVITNGGLAMPKQNYVVEKVLAPLWGARDAVAGALVEHESWESAYNRLSLLPGFGGSGFMAKEVLQDVLMMYTGNVKDRVWWTPVGPGARRGLNRLYGRTPLAPLTEAAAVAEVQQIHHVLAPWWLAHAGRELTAHDVQFVLCEFDKYRRAVEGGRPKQTYTPRSE